MLTAVRAAPRCSTAMASKEAPSRPGSLRPSELPFNVVVQCFNKLKCGVEALLSLEYIHVALFPL